MSRDEFKSKSYAYTKLTTEYFFESVTIKQLYKVAKGIINEISKKGLTITPCSREESRLKSKLLKWYDDNWDQIEGYLSRIVAIDENGNELSSFDSKKKFLFKFKDEEHENEPGDQSDFCFDNLANYNFSISDFSEETEMPYF